MASNLESRGWLTKLQGNVGELLPRCANEQCHANWNLGRLVRRRLEGIRSHSKWYCSEKCFERGALEELHRLMLPASAKSSRPHRIPLGLLLMSHGVIDHYQLTSALLAQRQAGRGRIGEWLREIGAAGEREITKALGEQWGCPVLKTASLYVGICSEIPLRLLEESLMIPVHYVPATRTVYMAFGRTIEYSPLYAIEQMLDCHAVPCAVTETIALREMDVARRSRMREDVVFEGGQTELEMTRIIRNYALQVHADEARFVKAGDYIWVQLRRHDRKVDLLFRVANQQRKPASDRSLELS